MLGNYPFLTRQVYMKKLFGKKAIFMSWACQVLVIIQPLFITGVFDAVVQIST